MGSGKIKEHTRVGLGVVCVLAGATVDSQVDHSPVVWSQNPVRTMYPFGWQKD